MKARLHTLTADYNECGVLIDVLDKYIPVSRSKTARYRQSCWSISRSYSHWCSPSYKWRPGHCPEDAVPSLPTPRLLKIAERDRNRPAIEIYADFLLLRLCSTLPEMVTEANRKYSSAQTAWCTVASDWGQYPRKRWVNGKSRKRSGWFSHPLFWWSMVRLSEVGMKSISRKKAWGGLSIHVDVTAVVPLLPFRSITVSICLSFNSQQEFSLMVSALLVNSGCPGIWMEPLSIFTAAATTILECDENALGKVWDWNHW